MSNQYWTDLYNKCLATLFLSGTVIKSVIGKTPVHYFQFHEGLPPLEFSQGLYFPKLKIDLSLYGQKKESAFEFQGLTLTQVTCTKDWYAVSLYGDAQMIGIAYLSEGFMVGELTFDDLTELVEGCQDLKQLILQDVTGKDELSREEFKSIVEDATKRLMSDPSFIEFIMNSNDYRLIPSVFIRVSSTDSWAEGIKSKLDPNHAAHLIDLKELLTDITN